MWELLLDIAISSLLLFGIAVIRFELTRSGMDAGHAWLYEQIHNALALLCMAFVGLVTVCRLLERLLFAIDGLKRAVYKLRRE